MLFRSNDTATTEIYTLSLHDALPIWGLDPSLAFAAIYLQLFTYFLVEKLFGGKQHLGMPDDRAIAQLIRMSTEGLWRGPAADTGRGRRKL